LALSARVFLRTLRDLGGSTWNAQEIIDDTSRGSEIGAQTRERDQGMSKPKNRHIGTSLDDLLREEGVYEETQAQAIKEVVAWQLAKAMKARKLSRARLAVLLKTSRTQVNRLLDPTHDSTISSLQRAAKLVGRKVRLDLV
jgi:predicted XRE-type DNA-binding protein